MEPQSFRDQGTIYTHHATGAVGLLGYRAARCQPFLQHHPGLLRPQAVGSQRLWLHAQRPALPVELRWVLCSTLSTTAHLLTPLACVQALQQEVHSALLTKRRERSGVPPLKMKENVRRTGEQRSTTVPSGRAQLDKAFTEVRSHLSSCVLLLLVVTLAQTRVLLCYQYTHEHLILMSILTCEYTPFLCPLLCPI